MTDLAEPTGTAYKDEDLVYVDPRERLVIGLVEFDRNGNPKPRLMPVQEQEDDAEEKKGEKAEKGKDVKRRRGPTKRYYPWGTYKSVRRAYLEKKQKNVDVNKTLEEILPKALEQAFWD